MPIYRCLSCDYETYNENTSDAVCCPRCNKRMIRVKPPMKLGEILVHFELTDDEKIEAALNIQKKIGHHYPLGKILVKLGLISSNQLYEILEIQRKISFGVRL